jgi:hypothetical protein
MYNITIKRRRKGSIKYSEEKPKGVAEHIGSFKPASLGKSVSVF